MYLSDVQWSVSKLEEKKQQNVVSLRRRNDCSQTINFNSILSSIIRKSYPEKEQANKHSERVKERGKRKIMSWLVGPSTKETILSLYKYHYYIVFLVTFGTLIAYSCRWVCVCVSLFSLSFVLVYNIHTRLRHTQDPVVRSICVCIVVAFS